MSPEIPAIGLSHRIFDGLRSRVGLRQPERSHGSTETGVDVDDGHARGARGHHRQQRGDTVQPRAPYPVEVGTAITGLATSPPTTLASAPSIPATTTTASKARISSTRAMIRWIPATPTSRISVTDNPIADATAAASDATGPSAVPSVTTTERERLRCRATPGEHAADGVVCGTGNRVPHYRCCVRGDPVTSTGP